jgi:hypothetical protein
VVSLEMAALLGDTFECEPLRAAGAGSAAAEVGPAPAPEKAAAAAAAAAAGGGGDGAGSTATAAATAAATATAATAARISLPNIAELIMAQSGASGGVIGMHVRRRSATFPPYIAAVVDQGFAEAKAGLSRRPSVHSRS